MKNVSFPEEEVTVNDLYFVCYMIERVARQLKQPNKYVVNRMGRMVQLAHFPRKKVRHLFGDVENMLYLCKRNL